MTRRVRLGAVTYLNARPLVYELDADPSFDVRFDLPSRCAALLHDGAIDAGLIPSIEYLRAPAGREPYAIVPDLAIAADGAVASVAIYTTRPMHEVRSIALDTSSRTSVALVRVLCQRVFGIAPRFEPHGPDLGAMLDVADAALMIGDKALVIDGGDVERPGGGTVSVEKIDLGSTWTAATGLPFVFAFWAGSAAALDAGQVSRLQLARDRGVANADAIGRGYFADEPRYQDLGARYLRDNIKYSLGERERAGLELFYRYAFEAGVVESVAPLRFFPSRL